MENLNTIQQRLLDYLIDRAVSPEGSDASTELIDSGILDSLQLMDLVLYVQNVFDIQLRTEDVRPDNFRSVARLAQLIEQRLPQDRSEAA